MGEDVRAGLMAEGYGRYCTFRARNDLLFVLCMHLGRPYLVPPSA